MVSGTSGRRRIDPELLLDMSIPLPGREMQVEIGDTYYRVQQVMKAVSTISDNWEVPAMPSGNLPIVAIENLCHIEYGESLPEEKRISGPFPVVGAGQEIGTHDSFLCKGPTIVIGRRGATSGGVLWIEKDCFPIDTALYVASHDQDRIGLRYLYYALKGLKLQLLQNGSAMPGVSRRAIYAKTIPLPSLGDQDLYLEKCEAEAQLIIRLSEYLLLQQEKLASITRRLFEVT